MRRKTDLKNIFPHLFLLHRFYWPPTLLRGTGDGGMGVVVRSCFFCCFLLKGRSPCSSVGSCPSLTSPVWMLSTGCSSSWTAPIESQILPGHLLQWGLLFSQVFVSWQEPAEMWGNHRITAFFQSSTMVLHQLHGERCLIMISSTGRKGISAPWGRPPFPPIFPGLAVYMF